jgi:hypothetical protein
MVCFIMLEYYIEYLFTEEAYPFVFYLQTIVICEAYLPSVTLSINRFCRIVYHKKVFFKTNKFMIICIACQMDSWMSCVITIYIIHPTGK